MLINSKKLLQQAKEAKCAIPAINVFNLAGIKAAIQASDEYGCPLIISLAEVHLEALGVEEAAHIIRYYAEKAAQPIALHLDHGFSPEIVRSAIDNGFTSVMIDGSSLSFEENVKLTKEMVSYAHGKDVTVEAEIGHVGGGESYIDPEKDKSMLTLTEDAVNFANETGIDSLAVSIGTAHGAYKGVPKLDFERLQEIAENVSVPLVLHGGSGSGDDNLRKAVELGICKVNVFTDTLNAAQERIDFNKNIYDNYFTTIDAIKDCICHYYDVFGTKKGGFHA
jgi:ketose-bisphosphate aldolase